MDILQILKRSFKFFYNCKEENECDIFYVAGSQTLPPPLEMEEEEKILKQLKEENYCCNTEKNHSLIIKYEYYQVEDVMWLYNYKKWRNIKSIGCVKKLLVIL